MAPAASDKPTYQKDEKSLCFHGELLYEAKILDIKKEDPKDKSSAWEYKVHYKGWKNTWDDWVTQDRLRKNTEENRELAANLKKAAYDAQKSAKAPPKARKSQGADLASRRGSEDRTSSIPARGTKRARDNDIEKEDAFSNRPSIKIPVPDHLKNILVDDWEQVTKAGLLVPLPSKAPANYIIDDYWNEEKQKVEPGSTDAEVLEEFCMGMKVYFEKSLAKILLYKQERAQNQEVRKFWESGKYPDWEGTNVGDCYGGEHLARLIVTMPELIAQTNMDKEAIARLREELVKFTQWLSKHSEQYFVAKYEKPENAVP